jgi:hypothetical protein
MSRQRVKHLVRTMAEMPITICTRILSWIAFVFGVAALVKVLIFD